MLVFIGKLSMSAFKRVPCARVSGFLSGFLLHFVFANSATSSIRVNRVCILSYNITIFVTVVSLLPCPNHPYACEHGGACHYVDGTDYRTEYHCHCHGGWIRLSKQNRHQYIYIYMYICIYIYVYIYMIFNFSHS